MPGGFGPLPLAENQPRHGRTTGTSRILGPRWAHFPTLTIGLLGVQILWSVEMSYASPYLLSLGLTKSNMAIVFLAGPVSGFVIAPLIGVLTDNSTSRWGRRRPYMLGGCLVCAASMLLFGYTREFASIFTGRDNHTNDVVTVWLAILSIYLVDFSVNVVQSVDRALLVDTLPTAMQASGNAWAARMLGVGGIFGFFVGNLDLPSFLPFLGSSELQVLSVIVSVLLLAGHFTTAAMVNEKVLVRSIEQSRPSLRAELNRLFSSIAWLGWFPILFYTTMYISDIYARSPSTSGTAEEIAAEGTRLGARALFFSAILALATNVLLPLFTRSTAAKTRGHVRIDSSDVPGHATVPLGFDVPAALKFPLSTLWAWSHLLFGACMLGTFYVSSVEGAIFLIALTGIPWAVTQWAPFSLLGEAILSSSAKASTAMALGLDDEADPLLVEDPQLDLLEMKTEGGVDADAAARRSLSGQAGVILVRASSAVIPWHSYHLQGIHNIFIVIPQFLVTILCAVVFAIFESGMPDAADRDAVTRGGRPNSVVYVFRLGALWSFVAFLICRRLARELGLGR
ncbi:hypothetical protein GGX14DRAFT_604390 [Mycena pura]|uniref:MFS general substrate transporter n=1 Tax=Mycena pura TaxID=153505 RepID=A0AAD6VL52_9AGAR|nr:hypothetical protein GGX14DRAFT_604390 [Mycena pura]